MLSDRALYRRKFLCRCGFVLELLLCKQSVDVCTEHNQEENLNRKVHKWQHALIQRGLRVQVLLQVKKKKIVSIKTESMFSKEHFSCSIKHPATCIKAEEISEFSERFSELGFRQTLIFSSFTSQYRLRLCEFSKTPHVCFQSLSSPWEKHFLIAHLSSHISPSLSDCMSARPSHSMLGREHFKKKKPPSTL